jgi:branched-chain amino acid transport system permease protein
VYDLIQTIGSGLLTGLIYALLGLCIVLIYKVSGAFNFAIGQFMVIGSYLFYTMFVAFNLRLPIALPLGLLTAGGMGALIERITIKPLSGQSHGIRHQCPLHTAHHLGRQRELHRRRRDHDL